MDVFLVLHTKLVLHNPHMRLLVNLSGRKLPSEYYDTPSNGIASAALFGMVGAVAWILMR